MDTYVKDLQAENAKLRDALEYVVRTWEDPGLMGTTYQMPRAISEAKRVLSD